MAVVATVASEMVEFAGDGVTIKAYVAQPASPPPRNGWPGVIVIHEWWGLNDHIKEIARRLSAEGYVALAPDLYSRQGHAVTKDANEAATLMGQLSSQHALRDLNASIRHLKTLPEVDGLNLGIMGFCMGGTLALTQAGHNSELKAAVVFYGKVPPLETINYLLCPVLYHYAEQDGWVTKQEVERLRQGFSQYGKPGEVVSYPNCRHAFFNDTRPDVYHPEAALQAWQRTLKFFAQHLR
jgi:carboxymethylenebutenolidase